MLGVSPARRHDESDRPIEAMASLLTVAIASLLATSSVSENVGTDEKKGIEISASLCCCQRSIMPLLKQRSEPCFKTPFSSSLWTLYRPKPCLISILSSLTFILFYTLGWCIPTQPQPHPSQGGYPVIPLQTGRSAGRASSWLSRPLARLAPFKKREDL